MTKCPDELYYITMNDTLNIPSDAIVEKIRKLLALSTSGNQNESELALLKAKKFAAEHDIDLALIQIFEGKKSEKPIEKSEKLKLGNRKSITQRFVSWTLEKHFKVKIIYHGSRDMGFSIVFIGTKENIEIATYLNSYLNAEFMKLWQQYYKTSNCRLEERASYIEGLYYGLNDKLALENAQTESEKFSGHSEETKNQFALIVVNEKERLQKATEAFYPTLKKAATYTSRGYHSNALQSGKQAGANISLRRGLGNGAAMARIS